MKDEKISDDGKKSDGHITFQDYLMSEKFGINFT